MSNKRWGFVLALIIIFIYATLNVRAQSEVGDCVELYINDLLVYSSDSCSQPTPGPTATPKSDPTDTPQPDPTNTPQPTPTDEPTGNIEPYPDAPACETHDKRTWHGLWDYEMGCHYDHVHGDSPHELDDVLGTDIYELMQGDGFGSPWQTVSASGVYENDAKHAGYVWYVRRDIPCSGSAACVTNFRVVVHQHTLADASVRFHSYTMEGTTSDGGYFLLAGHMDFGDLHVPEGTRVVDVEGNHCGSTTNPGNHKQHAIEGGNRAASNIWYGRSRTNSDISIDRSCGFAQLGTSAQDPWIWTTQTAPFKGDYVCYPNPRCRVNATTFRPHLFAVRMDVSGFDFLYENGVANFEGWADRYGVPYVDGGGCTEASIDCTPFIVRGLQQGQAYRTHSLYTEQSHRDYDIYFGGHTSNWSQPVD